MFVMSAKLISEKLFKLFFCNNFGQIIHLLYILYFQRHFDAIIRRSGEYFNFKPKKGKCQGD